MTADAVVSRELKSLQDELSSAQQQRVPSAAPLSTPTPTAEAESAAPKAESATPEEHELRDLFNQLVNEATGFLEEAETEIAAHPGRSVLGALIVGILIGRLLGRR